MPEASAYVVMILIIFDGLDSLRYASNIGYQENV
ncbi:MAG: hypothetical protein ACJAYB_000408 [Psychromonas sp.]|jgi:hypothetical protein